MRVGGAWKARWEGWMGALGRREPKCAREARGQVRFLSFLTSFMGLRNKFASEVRARRIFQIRARSFVGLRPEHKRVSLSLPCDLYPADERI